MTKSKRTAHVETASAPLDPEPGPDRRALVLGVLTWTVFSVVAVALRGLRWDENYEYIQAILGYVPYPAGHPMNVFMKGFYSLQTWSLAPLMALTHGGPVLANGVRNVISLMATVVPPFLIGTVLTRRAVWGHVAAVLVLTGAHVLFISTYPINTWPYEYSNGHVGTGYAVTALALMLAGYRRTFFFLVGLMPAVHLGQLPPVLAFAGIVVAVGAWTGDRRLSRADALWALAGLAPSLALWLFTRWNAVPPATSGPYFDPISPDLVWSRYQERHASHRMLPWNTGHFALAGFLVLSVSKAWLARVGGRWRGPWPWLAVYGAVCAGAVWTIMAVHLALGAHTPFVLLGWMPYRLPNHVTTLLVPAVLAAAVREGARRGRAWVGALAMLALAALVALTGPVQRAAASVGLLLQIPFSEGVLFGLYGAACAMILLDVIDRGRRLLPWAAIGAAALVAVMTGFRGCLVVAVGEPHELAWALHYPVLFVAVAVIAGFVAGVACDTLRFDAVARRTAGGLCLAVVAVLTAQEWTQRQNLPVSEFERGVVDYLAARGEDDAMILAPHQQQSLQARLGHPMVTDMGAFNWIPYNPAVGPAQTKMYRDLFHIDFAAGPGEPAYPGPHWEALPERHVWPGRSPEEWRRLGREYGFRYVISPRSVPLQLPAVVEGERARLYRVFGP